MFTGIITYLGKVSKKTDQTLTISADRNFLSKIQKGISVCVNGICLTIVRATTKYFKADFMPETESRTNVRHLKTNDLVNLELPATPTSALSGHIVQGHVDGISKLLNIKLSGNSRILKFSIPDLLAKYITKKGSIAINGISLTIMTTGKNHFTIGIIPYTWDHTMLQDVKVGNFVNIETDILAKYAEKLLKK